MNRGRFFRWTGLLLILTSSVATVTVAEEPEVTSNFYQVHYLRPATVEIMAKQACGGNYIHARCKMSWGSDGLVEFTGTSAQQDAFAAAVAERDMPPATQVFQVHVLRAFQVKEAMPVLPAGAVKALEDLMQLLPYRGFELVDSGLVRTSGEGQLYLGSDRRYRANLEFTGDPAGSKPLQVSFRLRAERDAVADDGETVTVGEVELLGTTFSMSVGETVVVGTSKLNGGSEALVVLLSAGS